MSKRRSYSEMLQYSDYGDRLKYLSLYGENHISPRSVSNWFYKHKLWLQTRQLIAARDLGLDLGARWEYIDGPFTIHHINPISEQDIEEWNPCLLDPENLITTSDLTHKLIHYRKPEDAPAERSPNDTKLW